jgi:hypothetical protein
VKLNSIALVVLIAMCVWMGYSWWRFGSGLLLFGAILAGVLALSVVLIDLRRSPLLK